MYQLKTHHTSVLQDVAMTLDAYRPDILMADVRILKHPFQIHQSHVLQDVAGDSGHLAPRDPQGNAAATPKASPGGGATTPTASHPSSPARPSAYRSMSDTRVKKFDKLLGEQVVSLSALLSTPQT